MTSRWCQVVTAHDLDSSFAQMVPGIIHFYCWVEMAGAWAYVARKKTGCEAPAPGREYLSWWAESTIQNTKSVAKKVSFDACSHRAVPVTTRSLIRSEVQDSIAHHLLYPRWKS